MKDLSSNSKKAINMADDCHKAIAFAIELLEEGDFNFYELKLITAENLIKSTGPDVWRITFKPKRLIPSNIDSEVGAGGEIFVEVNLAENKARITGYGE